MADASVPSAKKANWALAALPSGEFRKLLPALEPVSLVTRQVLTEPGQAIPHVYFINGGLVSLLSILDDDKVSEVGVVGREGFLGLSVFLGGDMAPFRAVVQGPGPALRMPADVFRKHIRRSPALSAWLMRYADAFLVQVSQLAACRSLHQIVSRYCHWLLLAHDRLESDCLPFTQRLLAMMLSVRLASISETASTLQRAGLIRYSRGDVHIVDRPGLEKTCCACYRIIKERFDHLAPTVH
jgi:CRP-like cAMP-binding protein